MLLRSLVLASALLGGCAATAPLMPAPPAAVPVAAAANDTDPARAIPLPPPIGQVLVGGKLVNVPPGGLLPPARICVPEAQVTRTDDISDRLNPYGVTPTRQTVNTCTDTTPDQP